FDQLGCADPVPVADVGEPELLGPTPIAVHDHRDVAGKVSGSKLAGEPALVERIDEVLQPHKPGRLRPAPQAPPSTSSRLSGAIQVSITQRQQLDGAEERRRWCGRNRRSPWLEPFG